MPERHSSLRVAALIVLAMSGADSSAAEDAVLKAPAQSGQRVTAEVLLRDTAKHITERAIGDFVWADNNSVYVQIFGPPTAGKGGYDQPAAVEYLDLRTGKSVPLGIGHFPLSSPNGGLVAFLSARFAAKSVALARPDGKAVCEVRVESFDPLATAITNVGWSADSNTLALGIQIDRKPTSKRAQNNGIDRPTVRVFNDAYYTEGLGPSASESTVIWSMKNDCSARRKLGEVPYARIGRLVWVPHKNRLLMDGHVSEPGLTHGRTDIISMDLASSQWHVMFENVGGQATPGDSLLPSPDGSYLAFSYDQEGLPYGERNQLAIASLDSNTIERLSADERREPQWVPDGKSLWLSTYAPHPSLTQRLSMSMDGEETPIADLPASALLSPDGKKVAWVDMNLAGAARLMLADVSRHGGQWRINDHRPVMARPAPLASYERAERRLMLCERPEGLKIGAVLTLPMNYVPGKRYPLVVDLHGGPTLTYLNPVGALLNTSSLEHDLWASKGYAVLFPDFRSSNLYGFNAINDARADGSMLDRDLGDVMCSVDKAIAIGIADEAHMAIIGHSYGGIASNWTVTHSKRFKVGISYEGSGSAILSWGGRGTANRHYTIWYGTPMEHPQRYLAREITLFTKGVTTPMMFVSAYDGASAGDVYAWLFAAWRSQGIDAQHRVYFDEGHVVSKPANQRDLLNAGVAWVDRFLAK